MKINSQIGQGSRRARTGTLQSKYSRELKATFQDKALLSLSDERVSKAEALLKEALASGSREKTWEALGAMGPGWTMDGELQLILRPQDGLSQKLKVALTEGQKTQIGTSYREEDGLQTHYRREILTMDSEGHEQRSDLPVVTTQKPEPDHLCQPISDFFATSSPTASDAEHIRQSYYRPQDEAQSLQSEMAKLKSEHADMLAELGQNGHLSSAEIELRKENFGQAMYGVSKSEELKELSEVEQSAFALMTHPQGVADGLYRTADFYVSPGHLQLQTENLGWDFKLDKKGQSIPVADAVVIGAGPGGLSSAFQLARRGARVVTFEAETAGHSFSDAGAKSVHHLRTSGYLSNLVRDGFDYSLGSSGIGHDELEHPASLFPRLDEYGKLAEAGRNGLEQLTQTAVHDVPDYPYGYGATSEPATRATFFTHMSKVAESVATNHDNSFLCERSPVDKVTYEDGLYTIETERGHKVMAKNLIMSTGLTGKSGEHARRLPLLSDFAEQNPAIFENLSDSSKLPEINQKAMLLQERSLGNQAVRQALSALPEGSRAAMVGSGESALKGALEMLHLNPGLSVDLFVKGPVESAQVQIPPEYFLESDGILLTPGSDERARSEAKRFGTPLTPRSLQLFFEHQQQGRARLLEMGERFDHKSVKLSTNEDSKIVVEVTSTEALKSLEKSGESFHNNGLKSDLDGAPFEYDVAVQAIGYRPPPVEKLDVLEKLQLPAEAKESLFINTTGAPEHQMQTTIPGLAITSRLIAKEIVAGLPQDRVQELMPIQILDVGTFDHTDQETLASVPFSLKTGGLSEFGFNSFYNGLDRVGGIFPDQMSRLVLTEFDEALRTLYHKDPAELSPAEKETLQRGVKLAERMRGLHLPPSDQVEELSKAGKLKDYVDNGPS